MIPSFLWFLRVKSEQKKRAAAAAAAAEQEQAAAAAAAASKGRTGRGKQDVGAKKASALQRRLNYKPSAPSSLSPATKRALANSRRNHTQIGATGTRRASISGPQAKRKLGSKQAPVAAAKPSNHQTKSTINVKPTCAPASKQQSTSWQERATPAWTRWKVVASDGAPMCSSRSSSLSFLLPGHSVDVARVAGEWAEVRMWVPTQCLKEVSNKDAVGIRSVHFPSRAELVFLRAG